MPETKRRLCRLCGGSNLYIFQYVSWDAGGPSKAENCERCFDCDYLYSEPMKRDA